jgi:hypothetical protein
MGKWIVGARSGEPAPLRFGAEKRRAPMSVLSPSPKAAAALFALRRRVASGCARWTHRAAGVALCVVALGAICASFAASVLWMGAWLNHTAAMRASALQMPDALFNALWLASVGMSLVGLARGVLSSVARARAQGAKRPWINPEAWRRVLREADEWEFGVQAGRTFCETAGELARGTQRWSFATIGAFARLSPGLFLMCAVFAGIMPVLILANLGVTLATFLDWSCECVDDLVAKVKGAGAPAKAAGGAIVAGAPNLAGQAKAPGTVAAGWLRSRFASTFDKLAEEGGEELARRERAEIGRVASQASGESGAQNAKADSAEGQGGGRRL